MPAPVAPAVPLEPGTKDGLSGRGRIAVVTAVVLLCVTVSSAVLAYRMLPPGYAVTPFDSDAAGAVEVYVSDPDVRADLMIQMFDWGDWTAEVQQAGPYGYENGTAVRMVPWLKKDQHTKVDWAVALTGGARLELEGEWESEPGPPILETDNIAPWVTMVGDVQVIHGQSWAWPESQEWQGRAGEWSGEAAGTYRETAGTWPDYGSRSVVTMPSIRAGFDEGLFTAKDGMTYPASMTWNMCCCSRSLPSLMRIDNADPPLTGSSLWWDSDMPIGHDGPWVAFTDLQVEQQEGQRVVWIGMLLGLAAAAALAAVILVVELVGRRRWRA